MENVLILDFDGVLNTSPNGTSVVDLSGKPVSVFVPANDVRFVVEASPAAHLERVLQATGAKIVVSSSWRQVLSNEEIQSWLRKNGVPSAVVIGRTAVKNEGGKDRFGYVRYHYVRDYALENPDKLCVAVDDDDSITRYDRSVWVDSDTGITAEAVQKILTAFGRTDGERI